MAHQYNFIFKSIDCIKSIIDSHDELPIPKDFNFNIESSSQYNTEKPIVKNKLTVKLVSKEDSTLYAEFIFYFFMELTCNDHDVSPEEIKDNFREIIPQVNTITSSTARGIIYEKLRGTTLHSIIMPSIVLK